MPKNITVEAGVNKIRCEELNPQSQYAKELLRKYEHSKRASIHDAYASPSKEKAEAYDEVVREMCTMNGGGMRITGATSYLFSCAYILWDNQGRQWLIYHTPSHTYAIDRRRNSR